MFNLLPKANKDAIRREYRTRLTVVTLWFLCATFTMASVLLIPAFLLSSEKEGATKTRLEALSKSTEHEKIANLDLVLSDTKTRLALLSRKAPAVFSYELLMKVAGVKNSKVSLIAFSLSHAEKGVGHIEISGTARDRTSLLSYTKALEQLGVFEKVEVPISNFAKDADINFSIRASGVF